MGLPTYMNIDRPTSSDTPGHWAALQPLRHLVWVPRLPSIDIGMVMSTRTTLLGERVTWAEVIASMM